MAPKHLHLIPVPILLHESLYVGIDVGKTKHVAGFVSSTLLERHQHFEAWPALALENSREGFRGLVDRIRSYVPLEQVFVLLEHADHYHRALVEYLQEVDIAVDVMPVQKRPGRMLKTDKRDALNLANHLLNQLEKGIQLADKTHLVRRTLPPTGQQDNSKGGYAIAMNSSAKAVLATSYISSQVSRFCSRLRHGFLDAASHMKKPLLFIAWPVPQKRHGQSVTLIPRPYHMAIRGARRERAHGQRPHHETISFRMWIRSPITLRSGCVLSIVLRLTSDRTNLLQYLVMAQARRRW